MITVNDPSALRGLVREGRARGPIAYVPTMGALHEGHRSLVRLARREGGFTVVSIFVNPMQFGPTEDFSRYPRMLSQDAAVLEREGVDVLYAPSAQDFYPAGFSTAVEVAGVSDGGEGAVRPGHFRGVATVVAKLFLQVQPDVAFFGQKDLQQVAVLRRMARDLDFPVRIVVGETVREPDGLALSSRNAYLTPEERRTAAQFPAALAAARDLAAAGETGARKIEDRTRRRLAEAGFAVDYVEIVDPETMRRLERVSPGAALAAAVRLGKTRLIDNTLLL